MISNIKDSKLLEIVRCLIEAYSPEKIYLFGSHAREEADPDSDFDLMLIVPDDAPAECRRSHLAYERIWEVGTAADILVCTNSHFHSRLNIPGSLPAVVSREGRVIYAA